jgi:hypothetical protein
LVLLRTSWFSSMCSLFLQEVTPGLVTWQRQGSKREKVAVCKASWSLGLELVHPPFHRQSQPKLKGFKINSTSWWQELQRVWIHGSHCPGPSIYTFYHTTWSC